MGVRELWAALRRPGTPAADRSSNDVFGGDWESPFPGALIDLRTADSWARLERTYRRDHRRQDESDTDEAPRGSDRPLHRCLQVARAAGATCCVVETRYIDVDYRSEYSEFYSKAFESFADSTHRIHFFKRTLRPVEVMSLPAKPGYVGYMIIRPQSRGVIGRTMLVPPPDLVDAVRTDVTDRIHLFGQRLEVKAVPFVQQDARLGSCAHAASWICHFSGHLANLGVERRAMAEFSRAADPSLNVGRPVPSTGLSLHQISELLRALGLPPMYYEIKSLLDLDRPVLWRKQEDSMAVRTTRVACRYLNSGLPVIAIVRPDLGGRPPSDLHALTLCGYHRDGRQGIVTLVVHDDQRGPYMTVADICDDVDPLTKVCYRWEQLIAPLPEKLWLSGENAERKGCEHLVEAAAAAMADGVRAAGRIGELFGNGDLTVRTYAIFANRFKRRFAERSKDSVAIENYRVARFPRFIWVVEAIDRTKRRDGECVLGEVIFDATSEELEPRILATRLPGILAIPRPDDKDWSPETSTALVRSGGVGAP